MGDVIDLFGTKPGRWLESQCSFSPCERYRYTLRRLWDSTRLPFWPRYCNFIMLNPSTADGEKNDPTVERCERYSRAWGYDGLVVTNLFAFRATEPADMLAEPAPIDSPRQAGINDKAIFYWAQRPGLTICAWGNHGTHLGRSADVLRFLRAAGIPLHYLKMNGTGEPAHPLYLKSSLQPIPWEE